MARGKALAALTDEEYWRIFHLIRGDVEAALKSFHTYRTVNHLAVADRKVLDKLNKSADFWTLNTYALQTTFFIVFGRLFDTRRDAHSIQKLVDATIANPGFFSRAALRERKRKSANIDGPDPAWLVQCVQTAWEPTTADLLPLKAALTPHYNKFKAIFQPIRHKVYAHRSMEDDTTISALFAKTVIGDIMAILRFLHTLVWAINEMAWNATRPNLATFEDYEKFVKGMNEKTETFIRQLP